MHIVGIRAGIMLLANAFALWLADRLVPGFVLNANFWTLLLIALILGALNFFLKPILTLVLGPLILLTLGLGVLVVNAIIIYLLSAIAANIDFLNGSIIIQSVPALLLATLIVSAVNFIFHIAIP